MAAASEEVNVTQGRKATFTSSKVCLVFQTALKIRYNINVVKEYLWLTKIFS